MSTEWIVRDPERGNERAFPTRAEAEDAIDELAELGVETELVPPENAAETDGGPTQVEADVVEEAPEFERASELPERSFSEDPMTWLPSHFIDQIQGVPAINRKGYAVIAEHCNISVIAEPITRPCETGFEYAEFQAVASTPEGTEYTGYGSAHIDRDDDATLLAELAETRAMKRATAWATGIGMTAVEEMEGGESRD